MSGFNARKPTQYKVNHPEEYPQIDMTRRNPPWDPYDESFANDEASLRATLSQPTLSSYEGNRDISSLSASFVSDTDLALATSLDSILKKSVKYTYSLIASVTTTRRKGTVTAEQLVKRWGISLEAVTRTLEQTTQRVIQDYDSIQGTRQLKTLDYQLKYRHLRAATYTDMMFSPVALLSKNTCSQVFITDFQWIRFYPMKK